MSSLLFGLFLDGLEQHMLEHAAGTGVEMGGKLCQCCCVLTTLCCWPRLTVHYSGSWMHCMVSALHST